MSPYHQQVLSFLLAHPPLDDLNSDWGPNPAAQDALHDLAMMGLAAFTPERWEGETLHPARWWPTGAGAAYQGYPIQ